MPVLSEYNNRKIFQRRWAFGKENGTNQYLLEDSSKKRFDHG